MFKKKCQKEHSHEDSEQEIVAEGQNPRLLLTCFHFLLLQMVFSSRDFSFKCSENTIQLLLIVFPCHLDSYDIIFL